MPSQLTEAERTLLLIQSAERSGMSRELLARYIHEHVADYFATAEAGHSALSEHEREG